MAPIASAGRPAPPQVELLRWAQHGGHLPNTGPAPEGAVFGARPVPEADPAGVGGGRSALRASLRGHRRCPGKPRLGAALGRLVVEIHLLSTYALAMALNIKSREVEQLAADVAAMAGESKTEAIRRALAERRERLSLQHAGRERGR